MTLPNSIFSNEYEWRRQHLNPEIILRKVRKWGDPVMVRYGWDVNIVKTTNFQAVKTWNDGNFTFGAVSNFLNIPHYEILNIRNMQFEETTDAGTFSKNSKMNWLCSSRGKIYMEAEEWPYSPTIRWGTVSLGGNLVQVEKYETKYVSLNGEPKHNVEMAKLVGFGPRDWGKPLTQLLAEGLVHRCYCAYFPNNGFGDTPKGIIYSPFFSPKYYDFAGTAQPTALYLPTVWLED